MITIYSAHYTVQVWLKNGDKVLMKISYKNLKICAVCIGGSD